MRRLSRKGRRLSLLRVSIAIFVVLMLRASDSQSGFTMQGFTMQGFTMQGFTMQGFTMQGFDPQGFTMQGFTMQGFDPQGFTMQGLNTQGFTMQGFTMQGFTMQGFDPQGFTMQGFDPQSFTMQGMQLLGVDRERGSAGAVTLSGLATDVFAAQTSLQGLQPGNLAVAGPQGLPAWSTPTQAINYVQVATSNPSSGVQLQATPSAADVNNPGSAIYVPNLPDISGTLWNLPVTDVTGGTGSIRLYVADQTKDTQSNYSLAPQNDDIYLYTVYYQHPATMQWESLCPVDPVTGKASAMAMPVDSTDWSSPASRGKFTFACTMSGVGSKCARNWGYKPWKSVTVPNVALPVPLKPFYDSCVIAARANYCQDGTSYTKNGTMVDLFDSFAINPTAGLPYLPASDPKLYMMHEEYQISALDTTTWTSSNAQPDRVTLSSQELQYMTPADATAIQALRVSGMQSSRYADLDPGRSCLAAPYIDRCDPKEPYDCYRDANMAASAYGAFISVNSPRHCDHDDVTDGAPLDPLCNECVTRVCSVDPSCCGDPGPGFYPRSLAWDAQCTAIRNSVCRTGPTDPVWNPGTVAPKAGSTPVVYLHGAIGSFEGITGTSPDLYAEGWACDPDFPGASAPVQISVGGPLGAPGTTLYTTTADYPLASGWREDVAAECGGAGQPGRHGFHYLLPASAAGKDVYVYAIDLNTPGAPFTLLRGGDKPVPTKGVDAPRAAIWTGWLEPTVTGPHTFSVIAGTIAGDLYRVWINGAYIDGNFSDPPGTPGGFTAPTPTPTLNLRAGVRYGVRVEYLRPVGLPSGSNFTLLWQPPSTVTPPPAAVPIPATALYPIAQGKGDGLVGTLYLGDFSAAPSATTTPGPVDYEWTPSCVPPSDPTQMPTCNALPSGFSVTGAFAARFDGQIVPPTTGTYLFSADTNDTVSVWVDGNLVTDSNLRLAGSDNGTCTHDICRTGEAVSRTCDEGNFCAAQICDRDPACCAETWDAACLQEVSAVCHLDCRPTAPTPVTLLGGVKYDVKVELKHAAEETARGVKLKLYWALSGGVRDTIPVERLFSATAAAAKTGVGLNAAYFTDAFRTEHFDHVETPSFSTTAPLTVARATMVCPGAGTTACPTGNDALGALAISVPAPVSDPNTSGPSLALDATGKITIVGGGAARGATVTLSEGSTTASTTLAGMGDGGGRYAVAMPLGVGAHTVTAAQSGPGAPSSTKFKLVVVDPNALAPPAVTGATAGLSTSNGRLPLGGSGVSKATIAIAGAGTTTNVSVPNGSTTWTTSAMAPYVLPAPGMYTLTITETSGSATSATTVQAKYALPKLLSASVDTSTGAVVVSAATSYAKGQIVVADGDGQYFYERAANKIAIPASGRIQLTVTGLDAGAHVLKVFQRLLNPDGSTNLDGEPTYLNASVAPSVGGVTLTCDAQPDAYGNLTVTASNGPARSALRYGANIYLNGTRLAQTTLDPATNGFSVKVHPTGVGKQTITATLLVSSLSGGGTAETGTAGTCTFAIPPPPPGILLPSKNPLAQTSTTVAVQGTVAVVAQGALVQVFVDGTSVWQTSTTTGTFKTSLLVAKGTHVLTVVETVDKVSSSSPPYVLQIGDVQPPAIAVDPTKTANQPPAAADDTGVAVDVVALRGLTATDSGASVPLLCNPPANTKLPLGTTNVVCTATDAAGNSASTTQAVTVSAAASLGPVLTGETSLVVEATGPHGAAVHYHVTGNGYLADCAPPGSPDLVACASWQPSGAGLGFYAITFTIDPKDGTLYAYGQVNAWDSTGTLFKRNAQTAAWTNLGWQGPPESFHPTRTALSAVPAAGGGSTLYATTANGFVASPNGGASATAMLGGVNIAGVSVDPANPLHLFAWNRGAPDAILLFETDDGGVSWGQATGPMALTDAPDVNAPRISGVVFDPFVAGRVYAQISPMRRDPGAAPERVYRRDTHGDWQRVAVPPIPYAHFRSSPAAFAVAPTQPACPSGGTCYGTLFAAGAMSTDGGDTWTAVPGLQCGLTAIAFDHQTPGRILATDEEYGLVAAAGPDKAFDRLNALVAPEALAQDPASSTFYALYANHLVKSIDGGTTWSELPGPGGSGFPTFLDDVAFDPVDASTLYASGEGGIYKTSDGGAHWAIPSGGLTSTNVYGRLLIDPFRNLTMYASTFNTTAQVSLDGAGSTGIAWTQTTIPGFVAADPSTPGTFFSAAWPGTSLSDLGVHPVHKTVQGVTGAYDLPLDPASAVTMLQVFPDAARTVAVTSIARTGSTAGSTVTFSGRDAQLAPASTAVRTVLTGNAAVPVFDNSDGHDTLYVSGDALGATPDTLYKASLTDAMARGNSAFARVGGGQPNIDFRRLRIDAGSAGQAMYTLGLDDSFWWSHDGGLTWTEDPHTSGRANQIWVSPADGSVYAMVSPATTGELGLEDMEKGDSPVVGPLAALWKWSPSALPPVDATIVKGNLRVTCSKAGDTRGYPSGSVFPIATTALTCTAKDVFGHANPVAYNLSITVQDKTPPVITSVPPGVGTVANATAKATMSWTATATDVVDGPLTPTCVPASGTQFAVGVTTVSCSVTDAHGNKAATSFPVTVKVTGTTPTIPTLTVADQKLEATTVNGSGVAAASLPAGAVVAKTSAGVTLAPTCTPAATSLFALGTTAVSCSATDSGFTVTRTFNVIVVDTTAPAFGPLPSPTGTVDGPWGTHLGYTVTATDLGQAITPVCAPASGSNFAAGTTTVTCRATDKVGNVATARFNVVVSDLAPPVVTAPALQIFEAQDALGARATFSVSAHDTLGAALTPSCAPANGSWFPLGDTLVTCQATDKNGHMGRTSLTVRVADTTPPTLTTPLHAVAEATSSLGGPATFAVTTSDLVTANIVPICTITSGGIDAATVVASGATFPVGDTVVTCTATDAAGNQATGSFDVLVQDTTAPVITVPSTRYFQADASASAIGTYTVTAKDLGQSVPVSCKPPSGSRFSWGTTTVTCTAYDAVGNVAKKSFSVVVRDTIVPVISGVPANMTVYATTTAGAKATYTPPTANDAVDGARPVTCTPASGSTFTPGVTTVTCSATDSSANTATKTFTVSTFYDTRQADGSTFVQSLAANGSSLYGPGSIYVAFALTGASAPITNLATAQALVAPVAADGTVGTFVAATPATGTGNLFAYDAVKKLYAYTMSTTPLAPGTYRFRADLGDGNPHDVNFTLSASSFTVTPTAYNFGPWPVPQVAPPVVVTVKSLVSTPLTLTTALAVTSGPAPQFQITQNTCTSALAAGATCAITVQFQAQGPGGAHANLTVSAGAAGAATVMLDAIGQAPAQLLVSPTSANLGSLPLLTPSATADISVTNAGDQATGTLSLTLNSPDFSTASNQCPTTLTGHQTCHVLVRMTATALGNRTATLTIGVGPGGSANVALSGFGTQPFVLSPTSATFPSTRVGTVSATTQTFTVTNVSSTMVGPAPTLSSSAFLINSLSTCPGKTIGAGGSCTYVIGFEPAAVGPVSGTLTVNGPPGFTAQATLSGAGQ